MPSKPQVVVVGAGIVGASVAWHLANEGAAVTIVASDMGGTATRDSFSWLNATSHDLQSYYYFRRRSMDAWKQLSEEIRALDGLIHWCGSLRWDMSPEDLAQFEKRHHREDHKIFRVEKEEMQKCEPRLRSDILPSHGLHIDGEGAVEAAEATEALISFAEDLGADRVSGTVSSLISEGGQIQGVTLTTGEKLLADHVVLAAGVGSTQLCSTIGIELPVTGRTGLLVHSKRTTRGLLHGLVLAPGLHMRQTTVGRVVAGAGFAGSDAGEDPEKTARELFAKVRDMFNADVTDREALQLEYFTIGVRPMPSDGLPILGSTDVKGLTLAVMHSGVTLAPIVGRLIADEIVHGKKDPALQEFSLSRFNSKTDRD